MKSDFMSDILCTELKRLTLASQFTGIVVVVVGGGGVPNLMLAQENDYLKVPSAN